MSFEISRTETDLTSKLSWQSIALANQRLPVRLPPRSSKLFSLPGVRTLRDNIKNMMSSCSGGYMYWNCIGVRYSFKRPSKLIVMSVVKYDNMTYVCVVFGRIT